MTGLFQRYGPFFGVTHFGDFEFTSWDDVWCAINTHGHPLSKYARYIQSRRKGNDNPSLLERIRVSLDSTPPIVEKVYDRSLCWLIVMICAVVFWSFIISILFGE